jgi:hypothetical protein
VKDTIVSNAAAIAMLRAFKVEAEATLARLMGVRE